MTAKTVLKVLTVSHEKNADMLLHAEGTPVAVALMPLGDQFVVWTNKPACERVLRSSSYVRSTKSLITRYSQFILAGVNSQDGSISMLQEIFKEGYQIKDIGLDLDYF